jgi:hypothetical protein
MWTHAASALQFQSVTNSNLLSIVMLPALVFSVACNRPPSDPRAALVGHYRLHVGNGSGCSGRGIESSTLELRVDGTSQQQDVFKDGSRFVTRGAWRLDGASGVAIDDLRITTTGEIDKDASPIHASLIVQWTAKPNILLNPDDNCLFAKD